jgi:hypothetical protein
LKTKIFATVVALAVCGLVAMAGIAGARALAPTSVTIKGDNGDYFGKVKSDKGKCLGDRKVTVYKQKGAHQHPKTDEKIGSDTSERVGDHGEWSIGNSGFKHGKFYARVSKTDICAADKSKTIDV